MSESVCFDRIADRYDDTRGGMDRARRFAPTIAAHLRPGAVVEIGVGTGAIAAALGEAGHDVVGFDLSLAMLGHARPRWEPDELLEWHHQLFPLRQVGAIEDLVAGVADLDVVSRAETSLEPFEESPEELASAIEHRTWSSLWDLDEETWATVVQPVVDGLRALPDPQRPRRRANAHPVAVLERV